MERKKKIQFPKTQMPVSPINMEVGLKPGSFRVEMDDNFVTSAYCDHDEVQWLYFRQVTRGFSDSELMTCDICGRKLFVNEIRGHHMSSTTTPEVIGWLRVKPGKILELVLSESAYEMLGDDLLENIRTHDFSGSISTVKLYLTTYVSPHQRRLEKSELSHSLKLIASRAALKARKPRPLSKKHLKALEKERKALAESPLRPVPELIKKYEKQTKKFLTNPPANAYKWSRKKNLMIASSNSTTLPKTSRSLTVKPPKSFGAWKPRAEE